MYQPDAEDVRIFDECAVCFFPCWNGEEKCERCQYYAYPKSAPEAERPPESDCVKAVCKGGEVVIIHTFPTS